MGKEVESFKLEKAMAEGPLGLSVSAVKKTDFTQKAKSGYLFIVFQEINFSL